MRAVRFAIIGLAWAIGWSATGLSQATTEPPRKFDAASIRTSPPDALVVDRMDPMHLALHNMSLIALIEIGYGVSPFQVQAPNWMEDEDFSIDAETEHAATKAQMSKMLKDFLIEQFRLVTHRATQLESVYALEVTSGGFKLRPQPDGGPGQQPAELRSQNDGKTVLLEVHARCDLDQFANALGPLVDRPVVNYTGIQGVYNIDLKFTPGFEMPHLTPDTRSALSAASEKGPSLFSALSEQLGLKLAARKAPVTVLVIDHAARFPRGN